VCVSTDILITWPVVLMDQQADRPGLVVNDVVVLPSDMTTAAAGIQRLAERWYHVCQSRFSASVVIQVLHAAGTPPVA